LACSFFPSAAARTRIASSDIAAPVDMASRAAVSVRKGTGHGPTPSSAAR
jgi:hypothetical protein